MNKTNIEWVKNPDGTQGYTWNPITGCLNHINGLCKSGGFPCYAYRLANGRLKQRYLANTECVGRDRQTRDLMRDDPFYLRFWLERLDDIKRMPLPWFKFTAKGIFVCDMGELFGDWVPTEWQEQVFRIIRLNEQHRFYLLTKQPQNLAKWSPFPDNCWVGVTVTNEEQMKKLWHLCYIKAGKKFVSIEPLLGHINLDGQTIAIPWAGGSEKGGRDYSRVLDFIDWLIIGAQTRPTVYPKIDHVEELVRAADRAGVPVFLKDNLKPLILQEEKLPVWAMKSWKRAISFELRQELPSEKVHPLLAD